MAVFRLEVLILVFLLVVLLYLYQVLQEVLHHLDLLVVPQFQYQVLLDQVDHPHQVLHDQVVLLVYLVVQVLLVLVL